MSIYSPKLHRADGSEEKAWRTVPISPTLAQFLQEALDAAPESTHVFTLGSTSNLGEMIQDAAKRSSVDVWARTFDSARESCENEWLDKYPGHVVAAWLGHSVATQRRHYAGVRDEHFDLVAWSDTRVAARAAATSENVAQEPEVEESLDLNE
jgi:integrase